MALTTSHADRSAGRTADRTTSRHRRRAVAVLAAALAGLLSLATGLTSVPPAGADAPGTISAGGAASCALMADTSVRCWGNNSDGQLGSGTPTTNAPVPVLKADNSPLTGVVQVSNGSAHTCARMTDGTARCWGLNSSGQLGDGTTTNRPRPVTVRNADATTLTGIAELTAGFSHTCARMTSGNVRCWGANAGGQLGDGSTSQRINPIFVRNGDSSPFSGASSVAAGAFHTCARMTDGTARCWGNNTNGQVGDGSTGNSRLKPVFVRKADNTPLGGVAQIVGADTHSCARMTDATVRCWGYNFAGQLGDGTTVDKANPVTVRNSDNSAFGSVTLLAADGFHSCARTSDGRARCWGFNSGGGLGDGSTTSRSRPVFVRTTSGSPLTGITRLAVGANHTCARLSNGTGRCWGTNSSGQVGDGTNTNRSQAAIVLGGPLTGMA